jgi:thiol-disulfide isomerase/thioredoxin
MTSPVPPTGPQTGPPTALPRRPPSPIKLGLAATLVFGALAIVYALFQAIGNPAPAGGLQRFAKGDLAKLEVIPTPPTQPDLPFTDAEGGRRTLADFRGKVIMVNLWATWCAPCVAELPSLGALAAAMKAQPFEIIAISLDDAGDASFAKDFLARHAGADLAFYHDPSYKIPFEARARGVPTTILYDRSGQEIARLAGEADWASPEAKALIAAALAS